MILMYLLEEELSMGFRTIFDYQSCILRILFAQLES